MSNKKDRKQSLFRKIFIPTITVLLFQSLLLTFVIHYGGTFNRLRTNAFDMLTNQVSNTSSTFETQFNLKWTDLAAGYAAVTEAYQTYRDTLGTGDGIIPIQDQKQLLTQFEPALIRILRQNGVNGVFVILNDSDTYRPLSEQGTVVRNGICIRDLDQTASYIDREDLIIERAPASIIPELGLVLDSWWEANYTFHPDGYNTYYEMPLLAAYNHPEADFDDLAYFSQPYHLSENDTEIVSYSVPLRDSSGLVLGVLGVELSTKFLSSLLPSADLNKQKSGAYVLAQKKADSDDYQVFLYSGTFFKRIYLGQNVLNTGKALSDHCYQFLAPDSKISVCGSIDPIQIYNANTPFEEEQLFLIGLVNQDTLLSHIQYAKHVWSMALSLSFVLGIVCICIISRRITKPIMRLSQKVIQADAKAEYHLEPIGIHEIDQLTASIENLNQKVNVNLAKNEFFSKMSHDLRTPMNAIIGFSNEEFIGNATETQKDEYLKNINASSKYMLSLVNEILDVSKLSNQKMSLHLEPTSIRAPFEIVVQIADELAVSKGVTFIENTDKLDADIFVSMDAQRVQQIFINLLSNAVKYTEAGGMVSFQIELQSMQADESVALIAKVKDNGRGMSDEFQKKMFEQFSQESAMGEGTGLGLSIAKGLVDLMGGTISCTSGLGSGTEFTVTLLCPKAIRGDQVHEQKDEPLLWDDDTINQMLAGKHILVCEDHPLNMQIAVKLLQNKGMTCDTAINGQLCLDKFISEKPGTFDAILMDVRMPVMDGIHAAMAIRASQRSDAATIPILAMTANAFDDDIEKTSAAGMNAHVAKPVIPSVLYESLFRVLLSASQAGGSSNE